MENSDRLLAFALDGQRYALSLSSVENSIRAVEVTPLPKAPPIVKGVINVHGRIIPVIDMRKRFGLPQRDIIPSDHIIIAHTPKRLVALAVDLVAGVLEIPAQEIVRTDAVVPHAEYVTGVIKLADGLILIHDLAGFISLDEEGALNDALKENGQ
jgi:purine-binding chemotaxis protein CheW